MDWLTSSGQVAQKSRRRGSHSPERWLNSLRNIQRIDQGSICRIMNARPYQDTLAELNDQRVQCPYDTFA